MLVSFTHATIPILRKRFFSKEDSDNPLTWSDHFVPVLAGCCGLVALLAAAFGSSRKCSKLCSTGGPWSLILGIIGSALIVVPVVTVNGGNYRCLSAVSFIVNYTLTW